MKVAVVGSRSLCVTNLEKYLPEETTELISGGAAGVDTSAREYALAHDIPLTEFLPDYQRYGPGRALKAQHLYHRKRRPGAGLLGWHVSWHKVRYRKLQTKRGPHKALSAERGLSS